MKAVAQRKPAENHERQKNVARHHSAKQPTFSSPFLNNNILIQRKPICPCDGGCPRCQNSLPIQAKFTIGQPNDKYEQEADRVAEQVMSTTVGSRQKAVRSNGNTIQKQEEEEPIQTKALSEHITPFVQRQEEEEEEELIQTKSLSDQITPLVQRQVEDEEEEETIMTKGTSESTSLTKRDLDARLNQSSGGGQPLPESERGFFEPRFGRDFSHVRIHVGNRSAETANKLSARAFTIGQDIVFGTGQYAPTTREGRSLLAHELTHVLQQRKGTSAAPLQTVRQLGVRHCIPSDTIAGAWRIVKSTRRQGMPDPLVPGGQTDEQLLLDGFREICPLASVTSGEISVPLHGTASGRQHGCDCLQEIERDLPTMKTTTPPATVQAEPQGWSSTNPFADPAWVSVRHPDDPFAWGYWTNITEQRPYERRHQKPFWQTLAHEVCGHVWTYVKTHGAHAGGRGTNPRDHDSAIEGENLIAGEHGVVPSEQRGFQHERGDRPATSHAGESFLVATIRGYNHQSSVLTPTNATSVVQSTATTTGQMPVFIELQGYAHANEGGRTLAEQRAIAVLFSMVMSGISLLFTPRRSTQTAFRFRVLPGRVSAGNSQAQISSPGRIVKVYLYHNPRSVQHDLLPTKVYFDLNSTTVRNTSIVALDGVASFLVANPQLNVELIGRTDSTGSSSYNMNLGQSRANSVKQELLTRGVHSSQIRLVTTEGESRVRARSHITRWQDRHVEIRL